MSCGKLLADKYDYYQKRLRELKGSGYTEPTTFDGKTIPETPEGKIYKELNLRRYCCRKTLLTHVDLLEKI
jgi:DNA-directed RNA polymerase subunit N (RpoN/RPB10)